MSNKEQYFEKVYSESKDKIYRLCLGFMGNREDADDLYQEVLIKIWMHLGQFRNESSITTWLYRITTNTALLTLNRKNRHNLKRANYVPKTVHSDIEESEQREKETQVMRLYEAISTLKEIDRIIIGLLLETCKYEEIAKITGLNTSNVGVRINRIKKILNKKLK